MPDRVRVLPHRFVRHVALRCDRGRLRGGVVDRVRQRQLGDSLVGSIRPGPKHDHRHLVADRPRCRSINLELHSCWSGLVQSRSSCRGHRPPLLRTGRRVTPNANELRHLKRGGRVWRDARLLSGVATPTAIGERWNGRLAEARLPSATWLVVKACADGLASHMFYWDDVARLPEKPNDLRREGPASIAGSSDNAASASRRAPEARL